MIRLVAGLALASTTACYAQTGAETTWRLTHIDDIPYPAQATMVLEADGRISGRAPCNSFAGGGDAQAPDFDARRVLATKRACPDLRAETAFFRALAAMQKVQQDGDTLTLRGSGRSMTFTAYE